MMHEKEKHLIGFLLYAVFLIAFLMMFWIFRADRIALIWVSGIGCLAYVLWGIFHHSGEGRLNKEIALEYVFLGTLIFLLLLTSLR
jgi:hypothetical protein